MGTSSSQIFPHLGVGLRPFVTSDLPFLHCLYRQTRAHEFASLGMPDDALARLLQQQFQIQHHQFLQTEAQNESSETVFSIIEHLEDSQAIGKFFVSHRPNEIRIVDMALLPPWRNQGIGGGLIETAIRQGEECGKAVSLHVAHDNPARRLYERLGFTSKDSNGVHLFMKKDISRVTAIPQIN